MRRRIAPLSLMGIGLYFAPATMLAGDMPRGADAFARPYAKRTAAELTRTIDDRLAAEWADAGVTPAARAGDAEFFRRASLDIAGRIPTVAEVREFLSDTREDKRSRAIERLLQGPAHVNHMTTIWRELLLPEGANNFQVQYSQGNFDAWLRKQFRENRSLDRIVADLLKAPIGQGRQYANYYDPSGKPSALAFYLAKEGKAENLAASTSRLFMGVRLECAQCHDHPFATWKREQFWGYAAFFAGVDRQNQGDDFFQIREVANRSELAVPGTENFARATFLNGKRPRMTTKTNVRAELASWLTSDENPYFARAAVNRIWGQFFGTGLVDPVDDMGGDNVPSHPALLDELARQFVANGFDLRYIMRAIANSRAYQLTSAGGSSSGEDARLYARMPVRGLSPSQLYESVVLATGVRREGEPPPFVLGTDSPRKDLMERFHNPEERATEHNTSILQALTLMNGRLIADATSLERGATLRAIGEAPFLDTKGKIEALYLSALGREPTAAELERLVPFVQKGAAAPDLKDAVGEFVKIFKNTGAPRNPPARTKALADVFWALLNSSEFVLNH